MSNLRRGIAAASLVTAMALAACGGGGGSNPLPPSAAQNVVAQVSAAPVVDASQGTASSVNTANVAANLAGQQRGDGSILYTSTVVSPYFANIAAIGAVHGGVDLVNVQRYMQWYLTQSALANPWSIAGAITDYTVKKNGTLKSSGTADSIDAYAATFLSLAAAAYREGSPTLRAFVVANQPGIERVASAIDAVSDRDGLTFALPTYKMKYVMDNSEVFHGLTDLAMLRAQAFGNLSGAAAASAHALAIQTHIQTEYWDAGRAAFAVAVDADGVKTWPASGDWQDGASQLFPVLHGVVAPSSSQALTAYEKFSAAFPGWPQLQKPDEYPWVNVAFVALLMNDTSRASTYASAVAKKYAPGFAYPWYCAESGWYVRLLNGLTAPQTLAQL